MKTHGFQQYHSNMKAFMPGLGQKATGVAASHVRPSLG